MWSWKRLPLPAKPRICSPRYPAQITTLSIPFPRSSRSWCARKGSPLISMSALGIFSVMGRRRVARPPARMAAGSIGLHHYAMLNTMRIAVLVLAWAVRAMAQEKPVAIEAARLFDGTSNGLVAPGLVVVQNGRILQVGGTPPAGAEVIRLGDATLLPGLMDAHTHISHEPSMDQRADRLESQAKSVAEQTLDGTVFTRRTLMAGFTTVRNLGDSDLKDVALRNAIRRGIIEGPRILVSGKSL